MQIVSDVLVDVSDVSFQQDKKSFFCVKLQFRLIGWIMIFEEYKVKNMRPSYLFIILHGHKILTALARTCLLTTKIKAEYVPYYKWINVQGVSKKSVIL